MLDYILTAAISFSGLIVGIILILLAKEEQIPGIKYFSMFQSLLIAVGFVVLFKVLGMNPILNAVISIAVLLVLLYFDYKWKSYIAYPILGIMLYLSSVNNAALLIEASVVYLLGFPTAALLLQIKKKDVWQSAGKIVLFHVSFLIISIGIYLIFG